MADLDAASLDTVKAWFRAHYGPTNAVLVLAGAVDFATAKTLVTKYFGDIPAGPRVTPTAATVPTLKAPVSEAMNDRVATTRLNNQGFEVQLQTRRNPDVPEDTGSRQRPAPG